MSKAKRHAADHSATVLQQQKLFEDRWSGYGDQVGIKRFSDQLKASDLKKLPLFEDYELDFLEKISHDISVAVWEKDAILFEEGSYLDLAFFVVSGQVDVYVDKQQKAQQPIFNSTFLATTTEQAEEKKAANPVSPKPRPSAQSPQFTFLSGMDFDLRRGEVRQLGKGEIFGEIGTLNGWPQSVTARVTTEATLVQIRLPALREMKKKSSQLKDRLDALYRERTLQTQLATTPIFRKVDPGF